MKFILTLCITCFLCACVNTTVQEVRERETGIQTGDSVVVIGRNNRPSHEETEIDFVDCVAKDLASGGNALAVVSEQDFKDQTFPWFEPRTAPVNIKALPQLLEQKLLADRLNELGIKYLIWLDGKTQRTSSAGSLACSVSPAGGGCFGFLTWENDASYEATIWDTDDGKTVGRISSDADGTSYMPAIVLPIPIIARVQNNACASMAKQLEEFLVNNGV
jgi:hypothetical protein